MHACTGAQPAGRPSSNLLFSPGCADGIGLVRRVWKRGGLQTASTPQHLSLAWSRSRSLSILSIIINYLVSFLSLRCQSASTQASRQAAAAIQKQSSPVQSSPLRSSRLIPAPALLAIKKIKINQSHPIPGTISIPRTISIHPNAYRQYPELDRTENKKTKSRKLTHKR